LLKGIEVPPGLDYPADQAVIFDPLPKDARVLMRVGSSPLLFTRREGREVFFTRRFFCQAWYSEDARLEKIAFRLLRNFLQHYGVEIRVVSPQLARVKACTPALYGSYGVTGPIAWNATSEPLVLKLNTGAQVAVPAYGWASTPKK